MSYQTKIKSIVQQYAILLMPFVLLVVFFLIHPFSECISEKHAPLAQLSPAQKSNIQIATQAIDGYVLKPGEEFSFNRVVGPRSEARGYRYAPSYLSGESPATAGGGICLLSSYLYQAALASGLEITQRIPHLRSIKTVPPGLDATVWYGQSDLRFRNTIECPIAIKCNTTAQELTIKVLGRPSQRKDFAICRLTKRQTDKEILVEVFLDDGEREKLISRDLYRLTP